MPQPVAADQSNFDQYVKGLIEEKFLSKGRELDPDVQEQLKNDIAKQLDEFIMTRIITEFSDEDVLAFENLMKEGKSQTELQTFAAEHIPDFTTFLTSVLLEFQNVYLS